VVEVWVGVGEGWVRVGGTAAGRVVGVGGSGSVGCWYSCRAFSLVGGGGGGALTSCVYGEGDEAAVLRETPRRLEISSFVSPLDSRKAIFRSVEASRISSSCRNREACSRRAALDGGDASFGGSSGLGSGSLRSCGWLWRCHDGIDAFF